jgi:thymidylate synthase
MLTMLLASCIGPNIEDWPDSIPEQQYFIQAYQADEANSEKQSRTEYLEWALSFYQGNLAYQSGWLDVEQVVLASAEGEVEKLGFQLGELGAVIGAEWAKHNDVRRIDTRMLALWGSTLQQVESFDMQLKSIEMISNDISEILAGDLAKDQIAEERYADELGLEVFGGF